MQPEDKGSYWQPHASAPQGAAALPPVNSAAPNPPAPSVAPQSVSQPAAEADAPVLSWQASEYVHHEKQGMWFAALAGGAIILILVAIFLISSWTFAILIAVMAIALAVFAVRPPRIMSYELSNSGIRVNEKDFHYSDFRYFGIVEEGPLYSAQLISAKRFIPAVTVYFPVEYGEDIVDMLGAHIPMHQVEPDLIDRLMRRLRF